ncbi:hypothetical protein JZU69_05435, partial [bacterium]|nr:hypothetical protein [bacterium]
MSTDGKILIIGKLNFAADNLSITGRLYADLSKIASGEATVLFLADIPEQVQLLSIDGRFKMGFRNPNTGEEAIFTVVDPKTGKPYARLAGPSEGGSMGTGTLTGRGYLVVDIPLGPNGAALNVDSVTDLAAEFKLGASATLRLDNTQAPVLVDGKFWYWVTGDAGASGTVSLIWLKETWSYTAADGTTVFAPGGAYQDMDNAWQGEVASTVSVPFFMLPYIDVRLVASSSGEIDDASLASFVASGITLFRKESSSDVAISALTAASNQKSWISLGDGKIRLFFNPTGITAGSYVLTLGASSAWHDSSGSASSEDTNFAFTLVDPQMQVVSPFADSQPSVDVNVANKTAGNAYIDVVFKATPGSSLDYASILDAGLEFAIAGLSGLNGTPVPIAITIDDNGLASYESVLQPTTDINGDDAVNVNDWYALLANKGVTQFRYATTSADFASGILTLTPKAWTSGGEGWRDSTGNASKAEAARTFFVEGPTVNLVSPGANGQIDIGALQSRGYIDVTWPVDVADYSLELASVTDLTAEFTLSGSGLGSVKLDAGQAPVLISQTGSNYTFRYWITGQFAADASATDLVNIEFIAGSWSLTANVHPAPTVSSIQLNNAQWLTVNFDNIPAGYSLDSTSITDLLAEFSLTYSGQNAAKTGAGTISLVDGVAPQRLGDTNSYRFRVSGDFATDSTQTVTLGYIDHSWSFSSEAVATATNQSVDASDLAAASKSYIDIALKPSVDLTPTTTPQSIIDIPDNAQIALSGNGITGPPLNPTGIATDLGNGLYRYYVDANRFQITADGAVTVTVAANAIEDNLGNKNRETTQAFTVVGTTASVTGPADGGLIGLASQNNRGFLDVTFGFPSGKSLSLDTIYDLGAEFTIDSASGHTLQLDGTQAPVQIKQNGNTYTFRYFTLGTYTSGTVTVTLLAGRIGFA